MTLAAFEGQCPVCHREATLIFPLSADERAEKEQRIEELERRLAGAIEALESLKEVVPPRDWNNYAEAVLRFNEMAKGE